MCIRSLQYRCVGIREADDREIERLRKLCDFNNHKTRVCTEYSPRQPLLLQSIFGLACGLKIQAKYKIFPRIPFSALSPSTSACDRRISSPLAGFKNDYTEALYIKSVRVVQRQVMLLLILWLDPETLLLTSLFSASPKMYCLLHDNSGQKSIFF